MSGECGARSFRSLRGLRQLCLHLDSPPTRVPGSSIASQDLSVAVGAPVDRSSGQRLQHRVGVGFPGCRDLLRFYTKLCESQGFTLLRSHLAQTFTLPPFFAGALRAHRTADRALHSSSESSRLRVRRVLPDLPRRARRPAQQRRRPRARRRPARESHGQGGADRGPVEDGLIT